MHIEYKRDLQNNYLVIEVPGRSAAESYGLQMAEKNEIPGLLSFHSSKKDGTMYLSYEITSKHSLESLYSGKELGSGELLFILNGMRGLLDQLQSYLLNPAQLIFDPQYIYVDADRKNLYLCYLPGAEEEETIALLAEFFLKKLDHKDGRAVEIGYRFYQKTLEENFSLQKTLKDILMDERDTVMSRAESEEESWPEDQPKAGENTWYGGVREKEYRQSYDRGARNESAEGFGKYQETKGSRKGAEESGRKKKAFGRNDSRDREQTGFTDWLFQRIHPAVLLSSLLLLVILEIVFYFDYLELREFGGLFFLVLAVEIMINRYWRRCQERRNDTEREWMDRGDSREYRMIREEMYRDPGRRMRPDGGETVLLEKQRLEEPVGQEGLWLIYTQKGCSKSGQQEYPDIYVGKQSVLIGKIRGESDVILNCSTVSRTHARVFQKKGHFYVKDMNSKNGTFLNGEKLGLEEQREFVKGDRIVFAEVEYVAADRATGGYNVM